MTAVVESVADELRCYGFQSIEATTLEHVTTFINSSSSDIEDIVSALVAFAGNHNELKITDQLFIEFQSDFLKQKPGKNQKKTFEPTPTRHELSVKSEQDYNIMAAYGGTPDTPIQSVKRAQNTPDNSSTKRRSNIQGTPTPVSLKSPLSNSQTPVRRREVLTPSSKKYTKRSNRSEVVMNHGDTKSVSSWSGVREEEPVKIELSSSSAGEKYRYMFQKLQDRAHVLDRRIEELSEAVRQLQTTEIDEFTDLSEKTTAEVFVCGQVCCDCDGRLNTESVVLQGDMSTSNGKAVPVNISNLSKYSLFPGQTVVMKAQNDEGNRLKASQCYSPEPLPTSKITEHKGISVMVACGPFTPDNTNDYAPLSDLMEQVEKTSPDVLILMGPFMDIDNQVLEHSVEAYDVTFMSILETVWSKISSSHTQLVIVSSHKDLHHEPVYPTPAYNINSSQERTHFVMNPCTLSIDGVQIGLTATDVLFQMAANEISWDAQTKDRILRLSEHLLSQRSYFPVYPPNSDFNLDLELNEEHSMMNSSPHLMILSSNFNQFVKAGKSTVFANPGRLCKGEGGGTYMKFIIDPLQNKDNILENFKAEIVRI